MASRVNPSEDRFRTIFEYALDAYYLTDVDGRLVEVNKAAEELTGYEKDELLGKTLLESGLIPRHQIPIAVRNLALTTVGATPIPTEFELLRKNGSKVSVEIDTRPMEIAGQILVLGIVRDVTRHLEAEEKLRSRDSRLRAISEVLPDLLFVVDEEGCFLEIMAANEGLLAAKAQTALGKLISEVLPPEISAEILEIINATVEHGTVQEIEYQLDVPDGRRWFEGRTALMNEEVDGKKAVVVVSRDVTDAVEARQASRESEQRCRDAIENAPYGIYRSSLEGRFLSVNPALVKMLGYESENDLLRLDLARDVYVDPAERERVIAEYADADGIMGLEGSWKRRDGERIIIRETGRILRTSAGDIEGFEMVVEDVTESRLMAEQLRQAQKMEALGTLAGCIAHDFNNLLHAMLGYTDLALLDTPQDSAMSEYLDNIRSAGNRAADLVEKILRFSRESKEERRPIRLQDSIEEITSLLSPSLPSTIEIRSDICADCPPVFANPTEIHQVIMNLCTNAYHAMSEGGGILHLRLDDVSAGAGSGVREPDLGVSRCARLTIRDTGSGMDEETMAKIFDLYFTTKKNGDGTGLGLATALRIAEDCGGTITVASELGTGSTFELLLPYSDSSACTGEDASIEAPAPTGSERILFVDDEDVLVDLAVIGLGRLGYEVEGCTSSTEALDRFCSNPEGYDLVITDMTMPRMTGIAFTGQILSCRSDTPVILCTGFNENVDKDRAIAAGIREYVEKPVSALTLARIVRRVLDKEALEAA